MERTQEQLERLRTNMSGMTLAQLLVFFRSQPETDFQLLEEVHNELERRMGHLVDLFFQ